MITSHIKSDHWLVEAEHDGYVNPYQTQLYRHCNSSPQVGLTISDPICEPRKYSIEIGFNLHPGLIGYISDRQTLIIKNSDIILCLNNAGLLHAELKQASYVPGFGEKQPTARLVLAGPLAPARFQRSTFRLT